MVGGLALSRLLTTPVVYLYLDVCEPVRGGDPRSRTLIYSSTRNVVITERQNVKAE
jgi:hypothetical protein